MLIGGEAALVKGFYLVKSSNSGSDHLAISAESLIQHSADTHSIFNDTTIATDSTGVKASISFAHMIQAGSLKAGAWTAFKWDVFTPSTGTPFARVNFDVLKDASSIVAAKALGTPGAIDNIAEFSELLHTEIQSTNFSGSELLVFKYEIEVTTASGDPGSTAALRLRHWPESVGNELIVEVNV